MGFRLSLSMSISALVALALQGCAPAGTSIPKSSLHGREIGGGASIDATSEVTDQVVLEDSTAKTVIVVGSKEAEVELKKLSDKYELNGNETDQFRQNGNYVYSIRDLSSKRLAAAAVIVLDETSVVANNLSGDQKKAFKFVWSIDLKKKTIEIEVSKKTPNDLKTLILPQIRNVVISVGAVR